VRRYWTAGVGSNQPTESHREPQSDYGNHRKEARPMEGLRHEIRRLRGRVLDEMAQTQRLMAEADAAHSDQIRRLEEQIARDEADMDRLKGEIEALGASGATAGGSWVIATYCREFTGCEMAVHYHSYSILKRALAVAQSEGATCWRKDDNNTWIGRDTDDEDDLNAITWVVKWVETEAI